MTYSIVARDPETGQLGVAVESHYFSVGSVVTWAEAGVGAVATQSRVKVDYGPEGLALMRQGYSARETLSTLLDRDDHPQNRQVAMVDARGDVAVHTGSHCIPAAGHLLGGGFSVQANLMVDDTVWPAMRAAYEATTGDLADRLIAALGAAQAAGGDIRGQQSAALLIVSGARLEKPWEGRLFDLRVEDHPHPVDELKRLVRLRKAYRYADQGDDLMTERDFAAAMSAFKQAWQMAPEVVELKFWGAVSLFAAGREEEALPIFREVFGQEPIWADLIPHLAPRDLPDDPAALQRILDQCPPLY